MPRVSIIIPTINANPELLARCIETVADTAPDADLIIIDHGWDFANHCNYGAVLAQGDVVVFLNDDTEPQPGWLKAILEPFERPDVAIVGCRLVYPDGRIQHAGVAFRDRGGIEAYNLRDDLPTREVEAVTGACMAVRADVFAQLGGFDTGFVNGYEDVDLCLRAHQAGWRIVYTADGTVIHYESASGPARWAHVHQNIRLLQERWHGDHHLP